MKKTVMNPYEQTLMNPYEKTCMNPYENQYSRIIMTKKFMNTYKERSYIKKKFQLSRESSLVSYTTV